MKVLLIKPFNDKAFAIVPPIGLGYLSTALRKQGHDVLILDCLAKDYNFKQVAISFANYNPDVVGIQVFSDNLLVVKEYLKIFKKIKMSVVTIIGGPHPSADPKQSLNFLQEADFGFVGESEKGFYKLLAYLRGKEKNVYNIPGLVFRKGKNIISNPPYFEQDLDKLGFPAWDLINPKDYPHAPQGGFARFFPLAIIQTIRGCPYKCTFCGAHLINGFKMRPRAVKNVIQEIKLLCSKYGVKEFHITDDNFLFSKERVIRFCKKLKEGNYKLAWMCSSGVRLDLLDEGLLEHMKNSGCYAFGLGLESGSERILKYMKKDLNLKRIDKQIGLIKKYGIRTIGLFIIGFPTETIEDVQKTIKLSKRLPFDRVQFSYFLPIPGTEIYKELEKKGGLKNIDFTNYSSFGSLNYVPASMTKKELKRMQMRAFLSFYLKPKNFLKLFEDIGSIDNLRYIIKRVSIYMFG
ncbi:MAG: radical SAM protein [Candidatus Omnitrophota bacterium]|nr:radical SAM protein [Candidatus Omnitrophota bacterium]